MYASQQSKIPKPIVGVNVSGFMSNNDNDDIDNNNEKRMNSGGQTNAISKETNQQSLETNQALLDLLQPVLKDELYDKIVQIIVRADEARLELCHSQRLTKAVLEQSCMVADSITSNHQEELTRLANLAADEVVRAETMATKWKRRAELYRARADQLKCCVCLERAREVVLQPCSHFVLCGTCCEQMDSSKCPLCRTEVTLIVLAYQ